MAAEAPPPQVSISVAIQPATFIPGSLDKPTISITAISHSAIPVTIFTWPTIFNLRLAQSRRNFTCVDLTTDMPVSVQTTKGPRRIEFSRTKGDSDEKYFWTLEPETPVTFKHSFYLAGRSTMTEGHRYHYAVSNGEVVHDWWYGTRDDVMAPAGKRRGLLKASGEPIMLEPPAPVEFEVGHHDSAPAELPPRPAANG